MRCKEPRENIKTSVKPTRINGKWDETWEPGSVGKKVIPSGAQVLCLFPLSIYHRTLKRQNGTVSWMNLGAWTKGVWELSRKWIVDVIHILIPLLKGLRVITEVVPHLLWLNFQLVQCLGHPLIYLCRSTTSPFKLFLAHATLGIITLYSEEISTAERQHTGKKWNMCKNI